MEKKTRYSDRRSRILEAIRSTKTHPTAEWVFQTVKKDIPGLSLATVYRNIDELARVRDIRIIPTEIGPVRVDGDISDHAHFVCKRCKRMFDIQAVALPDIDIAEAGDIDRCEVVYYGTCRECKT